MVDLRICNREFIKEFIEIYKEKECLWKIKSSSYLNKDLKLKAYEELRMKLLEVHKDATIDSVKKKINSLRTNFRGELKKVTKSKKSGAGEDDVYTPSLWYFDDLFFLTDQEIPRENSSNRSDNSLPDVMLEESFETSRVSPLSSSSDTQIEKKKRRQNEVLTQATVILEDVHKKLNEQDDDNDIYAKHIACEIRGLSKKDKVYVKKLINDIIFEASLGIAENISLVLNERINNKILIPTSTYPRTNTSQNSGAVFQSRNETIAQYFSSEMFDE